MLGGGEQRLERVVARDHESSDVGQELTAKVKDDKEKVERDETDDGVGLGDRSALLEIVQGGVPGQLKATHVSIMAIASASGSQRPHQASTHLFVELPNVLLDAILRRRHGFC